MNSKLFLWLVVGALALFVIVFAFRPAGGGAGISNVDETGVTKAASAGAQVVDVRTAGEFQMGHIPGAINVPVDQLAAQAASWDRNATYVVYCATGSRSANAVETMKSMGFGNIKHFSAGIQAWNGQLERGQGSSQKIETNGTPVMVEFYTDT